MFAPNKFYTHFRINCLRTWIQITATGHKDLNSNSHKCFPKIYYNGWILYYHESDKFYITPFSFSKNYTWRWGFCLRNKSWAKTFNFIVLLFYGNWNVGGTKILDFFLPIFQLLHQIRMFQVRHGFGITIFVWFSTTMVLLVRNVVQQLLEKIHDDDQSSAKLQGNFTEVCIYNLDDG